MAGKEVDEEKMRRFAVPRLIGPSQRVRRYLPGPDHTNAATTGRVTAECLPPPGGSRRGPRGRIR